MLRHCLTAWCVCLWLSATATAGDYTGPIIDAHAHVANARVIDAYVAAMQRHNVVKVLLLGVGGVQKEDAAWIAAAARKYPAQVLGGVPLADPLAPTAAAQLETSLRTQPGQAIGEVHMRQVSRNIARNPADPRFVRLLGIAARHGVPVVMHQELDADASTALEQALAAERQVTLILAHGGSAPPDLLAGLLTRHPNLRIDLSGMHFQRTPALATESGPLDPAWKALIEQMPERFLIGIDVWAARLFAPAMLDRLMRWTRRILGSLRPDVAERVAYKNAAVLFRVD